MQDRAISAKFLAHRVYMQDTLFNFQKFFLFPNMAAIFNFRVFDKNENFKVLVSPKSCGIK